MAFQFDGISLDNFPDLVEAAEKELGETPEKRDEAIKELRKRLLAHDEDERHDESVYTDAFLLRYLRARKFRIEMAMDVIIDLWDFQQKYPEYFKDLKGEEFREMYASGFMRILTSPDKTGHCVSTLIPKRLPANIDPKLMMRWNMWSMDRMARNPYFQVKGCIIIEDFDNMSVRDSMRMSAALPVHFMMRSFHFIQKCACYRLNGIYVFNQPSVMSYLWAAVRPFMSEKMKKRVHLLGGDRSFLQSVIDPEKLPPELGGTLEEAPTAWLDEQIALEAQGM